MSRISKSLGPKGKHLSPATGRTKAGSVLPFVACCLLLIAAYLGFAVDLTRNLVAVRKAEFAADAAALYAYTMATNSDGTYSSLTAHSNMAAAISEPNGTGPNSAAAWNEAPVGPISDTGPWNNGVTFNAADDMAFVPNAGDTTEEFLQLTARRQGPDALRQIFMPAIYAATASGATSAPNKIVSYNRLVEIVGQPATRVGAGVPRAQSDINVFTGFACFPLAISNAQFSAAANTTAPIKYVVDLVTSADTPAPALAGHIKGCFVNDGPGAGVVSGAYYGSAQTSPGLDQLVGLIKYFNGIVDASAVPPSAVERGAALAAFDPAQSTFQLRKTEVMTALNQVKKGQFLIVPVIAADPVFGSPNTVVGFARMEVVQLVTTAANVPTSIAVELNVGASVVMRNTTTGSLAAIPTVTGTMVPAPVAPFLGRRYDAASNTLAKSQRGLVLAPTLSPRFLR